MSFRVVLVCVVLAVIQATRTLVGWSVRWSGERVDEVAVAGDMGGGDRDDVAVAGRCRHGHGAFEQIGRIRGEQGGGHQGGDIVAGSGLIDDAGDGGGGSDGELMDQVVGVCGHRGSVN